MNKRADRKKKVTEDRQSDRQTGREQFHWLAREGTFHEHHCLTGANATAPRLFSLSHLLLSPFTFCSPHSQTLQSATHYHTLRTDTHRCLIIWEKHTLADSIMKQHVQQKSFHHWVILWCKGIERTAGSFNSDGVRRPEYINKHDILQEIVLIFFHGSVSGHEEGN